MRGLAGRRPRLTIVARAPALAALLGVVATLGLAASAFAGTVDLGSAGGIDYRARNPGPIAPGTIQIGPDAECDMGDQLLGGGVEIGGDFIESIIYRSSSGDNMLATPQSWVTVWRNLMGGDKSATVTAACMERDVRRVRETKQVGPGKTRKLKVFCPGPKHVASGGGSIKDASTDFINSSYPVDDRDPGHAPDDGWKVRVRNNSVSPEAAMVEARCVGFEPAYRVGVPTSIDDGATVDQQTRCPRGSHVIGGGLKLGGTGAEAHPVTMTLDDGPDADTIPDDRYLARAGYTAGTEHKPLKVFAVCKR